MDTSNLSTRNMVNAAVNEIFKENLKNLREDIQNIKNELREDIQRIREDCADCHRPSTQELDIKLENVIKTIDSINTKVESLQSVKTVLMVGGSIIIFLTTALLKILPVIISWFR